MAAIVAFASGSVISCSKPAQTKEATVSSSADWNLKGDMLVARGRNPHCFPLEPGFRYILERPAHPDGPYRKEVVVLAETEPFDLPGIGKFECAVVQEEEFSNGVREKQTHKWYAMDKTSLDVYAFGEVSWEIGEGDAKIFDTTWRAGEADSNGVTEPRMVMPGSFAAGSRFALASREGKPFAGTEGVESGVKMSVPAGTFENCVRTREHDPVGPGEVTERVWAPAVGLVFDASDGALVASDAVPGTDASLVGKSSGAPAPQAAEPAIKIDEAAATKIALKEVPGTATAISLERKKGMMVYVVEVRARNGSEIDVFVHPESGQVIGTER